jgi:hypothetical protein
VNASHPFFLELTTLIASRLEGRESPESAARLDELLIEHHEARELYLELADLDASLAWEVRPRYADLFELTQQTSTSAAPLVDPAISSSLHVPVLSIASRTMTVLFKPVTWSILAVGLAFFIYIAVISSGIRRDKFHNESNGIDSFVATISNSTGVKWSDKTAVRIANLSVKVGEPLKIDSGTIELELEGGAKLVVEGPAECTIDAENRATLHSGKLVAKVPKQAVGFTLDTPMATIVDLGTEFDVKVAASQQTDVRVLKGRVDLLSPTAGKNQLLTTLEAGETARLALSSDSGEPVLEKNRIAINNNLNVKTEKPSDLTLRLNSLVLWLDAGSIDLDDPAQVRKSGNKAYVMEWRDRSQRLSKPLNLTQVSNDRQPLLVRRAIKGQSAVQFSRDRLTCLTCADGTLMRAESPRTVFVIGRAQGQPDTLIGGSLLAFQRVASSDQRLFDANHISLFANSDSSLKSMVHPFLGVFRAEGHDLLPQIQVNGSPWIALDAPILRANIVSLVGGEAGEGYTSNPSGYEYAYRLSVNGRDTNPYTLQGVTFLPETANKDDFQLSGAGRFAFGQPNWGDGAADADLESMLSSFAFVESEKATLTLKHLTAGVRYQVDLLICSTPNYRTAVFTFNGLQPNSFTQLPGTAYCLREIVTASSSGEIVVGLSGKGNPVLASAFVVSPAPKEVAPQAVVPDARRAETVVGACGLDTVDRSQSWDGDIAELLVYDEVLSSEAIQSISNYLAHKYELVAMPGTGSRGLTPPAGLKAKQNSDP